MAPSPVVIAGYSHTVALGMPHVGDGSIQVVELTGEPRADGLDGPWPRDDAYWQQAVALSAERTVAISWNRSQHLTALLLSRPFDFALRSRPDLPVADVPLVPEVAVRARVGGSLLDLARLIAAIIEAGGRPPIVLGSPPPKGDARWVRQKIGTEVHFAEAAEQAGVSLDERELSTPQVWLKSWLLIQEMMRDVAEAFSLPFCPSPAGAQTEAGFLREECWAADVTHANETYGMLMREQIARVHASL